MKANINGFNMAYDDVGSGPAVVLIHGFPLRRKMWAEQLKFLADNGRRAIAPDLRGYGESEYAPVKSMADFSGDIAALLDHLGIDRAAVGGMSMGGYVLLDLLARHPDRVSAAVFIVTRAGEDTAEGKAKRTELAEKTNDGKFEIVPDTFGPLLFARESYKSKKELVREVRDWGVNTDSRTVAESLIAMRDRKDYLGELDKFALPAFVIGGADDRTIPPENSEAIANGLPHAKLEILPGVGHMANMENPPLFNEALLKFLQSL